MENPKPSRKPRREVWWLDLGVTNHSLKSIGRCFEDRLNWSLLSSSNSLLRHVRSPKDDNLRRDLHQCPGYLREEITLTCDLSKSAIVSHAFPGPSERCSVCHQLVQCTYSSSDSNDSNESNDICYLPTLNNSLSLPPTEGALTFDSDPSHFAPVGSTDPFTPNIGVKSSDASSVMGLPPSLEAFLQDNYLSLLSLPPTEGAGTDPFAPDSIGVKSSDASSLMGLLPSLKALLVGHQDRSATPPPSPCIQIPNVYHIHMTSSNRTSLSVPPRFMPPSMSNFDDYFPNHTYAAPSLFRV